VVGGGTTRKVNRSKWGDLQPEVTGGRIQSPHSTASNRVLLGVLVSKRRMREGG